MSSMSHAFRISSSVMVKPMFRICSTTNSFFIMVSNSSLSRRPFPSVSAFLKASRRNSMNAFACCSASRISCSFRSVVAATMLSLATAVSTEIIVHDAKEMKKTKNRRHQGLISTRGMAMQSQLSVVVSWNKVKREVGTSLKFLIMEFTVSAFSSSANCSGSPRASAWPRRCVSIMAKQKMKRKSTEKIQMKVPNMFQRALTKLCNLWNILKIRRSRNKRIKRRNRSAQLSAVVLPIKSGVIHRSKMPRATIAVSR
mmetsp:Transcript_108453/g.335006  ORF Transcript_108453/g.335006 Transcript_108453/m.335006 type:complete len:256 (+) Transcript_108453:489-1256(+)